MLVKKILFISFLGLIFGFLFGYLGAFIHHYDQNMPEAYQYQLHWYDGFVLLNIPGIISLNFIHPADLCIDEEWDYRYGTSLCNALFWAFASLLIYWFFLAIRRNWIT